MSKNKTFIVFTGGGSGGHALSALSMIDYLNPEEVGIKYIGGHYGIEKQLAKDRGISYLGISTGKLRRYFSWQNFTDLFRIVWGTFQSFVFFALNPKYKIVVGTGGFVTVPVIVAAKVLRRKILIQEQTTQIGLANKICSYLADTVCVSFKSSLKLVQAKKVVYSGYPLRREILEWHKRKPESDGSKSKPVLFITGGGNGSQLINQLVLNNLGQLKNQFHIIHQVGGQFVDQFKALSDKEYEIHGFIGDEYLKILSRADLVIGRSGAGTVSEIRYFGKKAIFIPLKIAQKNEQYHNAKDALNDITGKIILEDELKKTDLVAEIKSVLAAKEKLASQTPIPDARKILLSEINNL
jgi:UDP-N-acetylglucosamine--N-acetylmuramyl-(pentapeptide) pyrophosphoryl-undecaprenol N-acetylglucosamine transferase